MEDVLLYFALKYDGDFDHIYKALETKETVDNELFIQLKKKIKSKYTTIISPDYPSNLKTISCPPFVLFYYRNLSLLNNKIFAMVGDKEVSNNSKNAISDIVKNIVLNNHTILSDLDNNTSEYIHKTVISNNGETIAVIGSGIDNYIKKDVQKLYTEIKKHHLIISEYPNDFTPKQIHFIRKNRLISALSQKLIVAECSDTSTIMTTVNFSLDYGKDIFCIPVSMDNNKNGTNLLIKNGAKLITSITDVLY